MELPRFTELATKCLLGYFREDADKTVGWVPGGPQQQMATILIAEDDSDTREVLDVLLTKAGHEVFMAEVGDMAVMQASVLLPGLILLDINMPELDGFEVLERLKSDHETAEIPVVVVSGRDDFNDIARGLALGAADYITKPYSGNDIINAVRANLPVGA